MRIAATDDTNETPEWIGSDKVEGTPVYGTDGASLGVVRRLMLDKRTGRVEHAVVAFGGFLGLGESHYALPWSLLTYDVERGGYVIGLTEAEIRAAVDAEADDAPLPSGPALA